MMDGSGSLTVFPCLVLIFVIPRQTNRSFLSSGGMLDIILSYQAEPGRPSLLSLLSRMTSDLLSVRLSKSHCKCFQVKISFQKRHKKPPQSTVQCVCSNILRSSPTQHVHCDISPLLSSECNKQGKGGELNRFIIQRYFFCIHFYSLFYDIL